MRGWSLLAAILTVAISVGCGGGGGIGAKGGQTAGVPAGQVALSPVTLNFGKVPVGHSKSQAATLTAGNASITVSSAEWSGHGYSVSGIAFPARVPAGQSLHFKVTFSPQTTGAAPGAIRFISDADNSPRAILAGSGVRQHQVTLSWRSARPGITGYNIYRANGAKGPYAKLNSVPHPRATFTDTTVEGGRTYFYIATAVNKHGRESKYSNQVRVIVPNS
jgi:hypothetical protein